MKLYIEIDGKTRSVEYTPGANAVKIDGVDMEADAQQQRPGVLSVIMDGRAWRVVLEEHEDEPALHLAGKRIAYRLDDPRSLKARRAHAGGADGPKAIKASMPGRVVRVVAQPGDLVEAHQGVVVIEAMKMQNELKSPKSGRVAELRVSAGDTVVSGDVLAVIE
ncbi:MAG TPA: biotin/lipoyl-containing protein [Acidobacteriaceae bacterium]|nr:biotin/lipoyl-containing protein [Acidobacteriaceae bacterium]